jgi:FkbM family methyltransferase
MINNVIEYWDNNLVERHIGTEINWLFSYLDENKINEVSYIDIGSNVGKFYDVISKKYTIKKCIMVEPSKVLFDHMSEKYLGIDSIELHNFAISDENGNYELDTSVNDSINYFNEIGIDESINLGLTKLDKKKSGNTLCYSMEYFLKNINTIPLKDITFIKIDTENNDLQIIKSMTELFKNNNINPFILFENNYHNDMSDVSAKEIMSNFTKECGYEEVDLSYAGDNFIKPIKK